MLENSDLLYFLLFWYHDYNIEIIEFAKSNIDIGFIGVWILFDVLVGFLWGGGRGYHRFESVQLSIKGIHLGCHAVSIVYRIWDCVTVVKSVVFLPLRLPPLSVVLSQCNTPVHLYAHHGTSETITSPNYPFNYPR